MLDNSIKEQLKNIFSRLESHIAFLMLSRPDDVRSAEMLEFLQDVAATSPNLSVETGNADSEAPEFEIVKDGTTTGVNSTEYQTVMSFPLCYWPCLTPTDRAKICPTLHLRHG